MTETSTADILQAFREKTGGGGEREPQRDDADAQDPTKFFIFFLLSQLVQCGRLLPMRVAIVQDFYDSPSQLSLPRQKYSHHIVSCNNEQTIT